MDHPIPQEFVEAARAEITSVGYYRTDPRIDVQIEKDTIVVISTSTIVPFDGRATIRPPTAIAAQGLRSVKQTYHVDGNQVTQPFQLGTRAKDDFMVEFRRENDAVKRITDTHRWVSPVTKFIVTFKFGDVHTCGLTRLLMTRPGLKFDQVRDGHWEYAYPFASFSGQGFNWYVDWAT